MTARRLTITSDSSELARVRSWLREQLAEHGFPAAEQSGLQVAVTELAANAIEHSYQGMSGQPIYITVEPGADRVVIQIEDFGTPFDPARYRAPELDAPAESGLGLYLARRLADELSVDLTRDRGTRWTLVKYRGHRRAHRSAEEERWTSK
jgi:anti-sigma regulatory factor (Ser/Thr protein kinase)